MTSVASGGTAERMVARIVFKVVRAGSGTPARYSSMLFGASLVSSAALRRAGFLPFTEEDYKNFHAYEDLFSQKVTKQNEGRIGEFSIERSPFSYPFVSFVIFCKEFSSLFSFARGTQVLTVLMQHQSDHLTGPIAFEIQLCIHDLIEELVGCAGVDRKGWLPRELRLKLGVL
jgi:hypothetical protein